MSTARTFGTYVGSAALIKRGTGGTLYEQGFDVLVALLLAVASGVTWFWEGGETMWISNRHYYRNIRGPTGRAFSSLPSAACGGVRSQDRCIRKQVQELSCGSSSLIRHTPTCSMQPWLAGLLMLSVARFVVVVLMSMETAEAIGLHIPLWHMAAAIPFVVISSLIALTPGGLGVSELTTLYGGAQHLWNAVGHRDSMGPRK